MQNSRKEQQNQASQHKHSNKRQPKPTSHHNRAPAGNQLFHVATAAKPPRAQTTKSQYEEFREAFDFFDVNQDGYITTDELEMAMSKCGVFPSKLELRLVMTQGDADGNGVITFDEFASLMEGQHSRRPYDLKQLREQFKLFDKDNDGFIELKEMVDIVKELHLGRLFPHEIIDKLFREADVDHDGRISFPEFVMAVN